MLTALMKIKTEMSCVRLSEPADFKATADLDYKNWAFVWILTAGNGA